MEFTAEVIAGFLKGEIAGDPTVIVNTVAKIEEGHEGAISFLANPKYEHYIYTTGSSIVLVNSDFVPSAPVKATIRFDATIKLAAASIQSIRPILPRF